MLLVPSPLQCVIHQLPGNRERLGIVRLFERRGGFQEQVGRLDIVSKGVLVRYGLRVGLEKEIEIAGFHRDLVPHQDEHFPQSLLDERIRPDVI